jgi:hypothetical protein
MQNKRRPIFVLPWQKLRKEQMWEIFEKEKISFVLH